MLAATGLLAVVGSASAADTFRLGLPARDDAPAVQLGRISADADTVDAAYRGYYGGYRGGYGGYRGYGYGGYRGGYYGGYRGGYGGYYGGYRGYGYGGYRGYYGGYRGYGYGGYYGGYRGYGYGGYRGGYYGGYRGGYGGYYGISLPLVTPAISVYSTVIEDCPYSYDGGLYGYSPINSDPNETPTFRLAQAPPQEQPYAGGAYVNPSAGSSQTFPYDGGPRVVAPSLEAAPTPRLIQPAAPQPTVPLEGRPVSLPAVKPATKFAYPAYGEEPTRTSTFATDPGLRTAKR